MTERHAELETALDRVVAAARAHLGAILAADGRSDDDEVWRAYVELNNASLEYDELLLDVFGEVTPWDVEAIDPEEADPRFGVGLGGDDPDDPYPSVISVRQRRDYRVPSVKALLQVATMTRRSMVPEGSVPVSDVESVGEAVIELMQAGDGALGALDVPELESLDGVVVVAEVGEELDPAAYPDSDGSGPFELAKGDRVVDRLDEHPCLDLDVDLGDEVVDLADEPRAGASGR